MKYKICYFFNWVDLKLSFYDFCLSLLGHDHYGILKKGLFTRQTHKYFKNVCSLLL